MSWTILENSLLVSLSTTVLCVEFGFCAALCLSCVGQRTRNWLLIAASVALVLPPFLVTNCWLNLLGYTGSWRNFLPSIYSLPGVVWILTMLNWPIVLLFVLSAWQKLDAAHLDNEPGLTGLALIRWLLLPQCRAQLAQARVLVFALALNNLSVPAILQTKVFPAEVWVSFNTEFDYAAALKLSLPLLVAPLLVLACFWHGGFVWRRLGLAVSPALFRSRLGEGWFWSSGAVTASVLCLATALPLVTLLSVPKTWQELLPALEAGTAAARYSLGYAAGAATVCLVIGLLTWRFRNAWLLWLPFFLPGVLLGIGLVFTLNRPLFAAFYQSTGIVVLGLTIRYAAVASQGSRCALRGVDPDLTDAARIDGAPAWQMLRQVYWPQVSRQILACWYIIYLLALWDVETLLLIYPPGGETLAVRIFNLLHYGHTAQVNGLCLILLALAGMPALLWLGWHRLRLAFRPARSAAVGVGFIACLNGCVPAPSSGEPLSSQLFSHVQVIGSRGTGLGQFNKPRSVAVDAQDNLYVVDMTGRVQKFSPEGVFLLSWQMPQTDKGKPKGMSRDFSGNIIVIEPHYSRVNHFGPDGKLVAQWGVTGTNAGQLSFPRSVAVNSKGEIYVSEYGIVERVQRFTPFGKEYLGSNGHEGNGAGEFSRPEGLAVDANDRLYVADSCNHRIQIFSPEGRFLRTHGRPGSGSGELSYPYDVQVDRAGRQYVCEFGNSRIQIFDDQDRLVEILGGPGAAPGKFSNPWGIAFDSKGNLYVADSLNHRVQKFVRKQPVAGGPFPTLNHKMFAGLLSLGRLAAHSGDLQRGDRLEAELAPQPR